MRVMCIGAEHGRNECTSIGAGDGIAVGRLFEQPGDHMEVRKPGPGALSDANPFVESRGQLFVSKYWGRYVAFLRNRRQLQKWVIRSASGELDCLSAKHAGLNLYFSDLDCILGLRGLRLSVDWDFVAADLLGNTPETRRTGLKEVTRLLHGECVELSISQETRNIYWNPWEFAQRPFDFDVDLAANRLREMTRYCVSSWASCHSSVVQLLSGGLDSSIVASCLQAAPSAPRVTCVNYYSS